MAEILVSLELQARSLKEILSERMDGADRPVRRPSLKERLGLKGLGCCGPTWGLGPTTMRVEEVEEEGDGPMLSPQIEAPNPILPCGAHQSPTGMMNLAVALAAERQLRAALEFDIGGPNPNSYEERSPSPSGGPGAGRVSLMRLLEETDGCDGEVRKEGGDWVCCVCMGRKKGAAFIPCGHTFCRVCSRELWLNRGSCPLCNRSILEILDIY